MEKNKLDKIINIIREQLINEEVPTNSLAGGQVAGTAEAGDDPPVFRKAKKYMSGGKGSRKLWMQYLKNK
jgi:hypothetical protein